MACPDMDEPLEARLVRSIVVSVPATESACSRGTVDVQHTNAGSNCPRHVKHTFDYEQSHVTSIVVCPVRGHRNEEAMPTNTCVWFFERKNCKTVLRPKAGAC
ncbi:GDCCVxC domain-containing (seleno)protein [Paraburkholderia aromaticivorans]|uniref:GDCCVxC domain-containing (seleno)protein n=1 Tax=Paraburkholderia aromaticivorans TaxID=2026199 RepID=UPI0026D36732